MAKVERWASAVGIFFLAVGQILAATAVINPKYDDCVEATPHVYTYTNTYLYTGYQYGPDACYLMYDLSTLPAPPEGASLSIDNATLTARTSNAYGASFQDGLYAVDNNTWDDSITYVGRPAQGSLLMSWDWPGNNLSFTLSHDNLVSYVRTKYAAVGKLVSFAIVSVSPQTSGNKHFYYDYNNATYTANAFKLNITYSYPSLPPADAPAITPGTGSYTTSQTVSMSSGQSGAVIRYTVDGTEPTSTSTQFTGNFTVSSSMTIKAKSWVSGYSASATTKVVYTFPAVGTVVNLSPVLDVCVEGAPHAYTYTNQYIYTGYKYGPDAGYYMYDLSSLTPPEGSTITINSASFYGEAWSSSGSVLLDAFYAVDNNTWNEGDMTYVNKPAIGSLLVAWEWPGNYTYLTVTSPALTSYVSTKLASADKRASFGLVSVDPPVSGNNHLYVDTEYSPTAVFKLKVDYTITRLPSAADPTFSPVGGGQYWLPTQATISCATTGATIRYTTDGTDPVDNSTVYSGPITVDHTMTIKAKAWATGGLYPSYVTSATYTFPTSYGSPTQILPVDNITVDGNVSDWAGSDWVPVNTVYDSSPSDIAEAYYATRWSSNKVYIAVKVRDTAHAFTDTYTEWNARDAVELYLHTNGTSSDYTFTYSEPAQELALGITSSDHNSVWSNLGYKMGIPSSGYDYQAAGKEGTGGWLYYEAAVTPYQYMGGFKSEASILSPLAAGQVIGVDVVVVGNNGAYTGMKSTSNTGISKSIDYRQFAIHQLVAEISGTVVLDSFVGDNTTVPVDVQLRKQSDNSTTAYTPTLAATGRFTIGVAPGTYDVRIKAAHGLSKIVSGVTVSSSINIGVVHLTNGDCDQDNEVSSTDLSIVLAAMGSLPGESNWDARADLDGDGEITNTDLSMALANLDMAGDGF